MRSLPFLPIAKKACHCLSPKEPRSLRKSLFAALALTIVVNGILILNDSYQGPDDDFGIATVLSGYYPGSGLCLFTNQLLNNLITALGALLPQVNAFLIVERLSTIVAYFAVSYYSMRHLPAPVVAGLQSFLVLLIMPECTAAANFTVVAAMCCFSGAVCACGGIALQQCSSIVAGSLLFALGFMWRENVALMAIPFFALCLASAMLYTSREDNSRDYRRKSARRLVLCVATLALCLLAPIASDKIVSQDPEYIAWSDYSNARSGLVDYPVKPYDEIAQDLQAIGVSEADYQCMTRWLTADPDVLSAEKMQATLEIARADRGTSFIDAAKAEISSILSKKRFFICLFVLAAISMLAAPKRQLPVILLSVMGAFGACVLLRYTGRCPTRVEHAAWLLSAAPMIIAALDHCGSVRGHDSKTIRAKSIAALLLSTTSVIVCILLFSTRWLPSMNVDRIDQFAKNSTLAQESSLIRHFSSDENVYIWDPNSFIYPERQLKYKNLPPESFFESNTFAGGWTQGSGFMRRHNEEIGVPNPLKSLVDRPNTFFVVRNLSLADALRDYLREHYGSSITFEIADKIKLNEESDLYVLRFTK